MIDKYDPDIQDLLVGCMDSTKILAKTFFPDEVKSDFSMLHDRLFAVMDSKLSRRKAVAAPRGMGKSTLAKLRAIKAILFRETKFIVYLSNSEGSAEMQTEHIKRLLLNNEHIRTLFGDVKVSHEGMRDAFSKKSWVAFGDVFILPRGAGQQVRGLNWMGERPGLIVIDDLENTENIRSDEQRDKLKQWFLSDLMKTESRYGEPAEFVAIDTIKHQDSLMQNLMDAKDWLTDIISICDDDFNSFDENYMTSAQVRQEYEEHKAHGKADLFYMEFMNIPISLKDAIFKPEYFKYYTEAHGHLMVIHDVNRLGKKDEQRVKVADLITIVIVDPAKTVNMNSADSAIVVLSVDRKKGRIFVRFIINGKFMPNELYEHMFGCVLMYQAEVLAVEVTGLNEFISQPIKNEMQQRGLFPKFISLQAKGHKDDRIATLAPNYRMGYMYHNKQFCGVLENQLTWHPKSKFKDVADAVSYINKVMDEHKILFELDEDEDDLYPDDFDELDNDELDFNWRLA